MTFNYQVGGSLPADAPSYVDRQCDRDYYELLKERKYCYVFNCRQMGKSSLRVRVTHKLQAEGFVCATIDPQKIGVEVTCEQWYASAIRSLVGDLNLKNKFDLRSWIRERELLSPVQRFAEFIETVVLQEIDAPIVIFVEEIDRLLSLKFGMDDFFGLVRSLFEDRPTKPEYNRLTFSFLGVATPTDLIQRDKTSAFNIGYAVEMAGFTLTEALPLMEGLANRVTNPRDYLAEAVMWSGGQPFLIQRLLGIIKQELAKIAPPENVALWVENLVQERVVTSWESQDTPPHLTTIRDRVLSVEEKLRGRMLGCYQQVLADGELEDDRSEERSKLRLTGLVVRRDGRLISYNPIYGAVFNNAWVEGQLADLRPEFYASAFRAWRNAEEGQNQGFLLRGQALEEAEVWAKGKKLSDIDEQFLRESREFERFEMSQQLAATEEANEILVAAERKASDRVKVGSVVLGVMLLVAAVAGVWATKSVNESNLKVSETQKDAQTKLQNAELNVNSANRDADRVRKNSEQEKRSAVQTVREALAKKKEADDKVDAAQNDLEIAMAELANISQESQGKVNAAQAKIADAEGKVKKAIKQQQKANQEVETANIDIKLADVRLMSLDAKASFQGIPDIDALLSALRAGQKLKELEQSVWTNKNIHMVVASNLSPIVYGVKESNRIQNSDIVHSVAFSPDGKAIAAGSWDNTVKLWSLDGRELQTFKGHRGGVLSIAFSPDGKTIASGSTDYTLKLWSLDGRELQTFTGHDDRINSIAFSPDGKTIVSGSADNTMKLWSLDGRQLQTFTGHSDRVNSVAFNPDGKTIVSGSWDNTMKLWSLDGRQLQTFTGHSDRVNSVAFNPDGKTIVSGSWDNTMKLWSLDGRELQTLKGYSAGVNSVAFSSDGKTIVSGYWDKTVKLWSLDERNLQIFKGHSDVILSIAFSPDGKTIASGSWDKTIKLWSLDGNELQILKGHSAGINSIAFSSDGKTIASGSADNTVKLWSLDGRELQTFRGHSSDIMSVSFSPDGKTIASGSWDNTVKLWDLDGKELQTFIGHSSAVLSVAFSPDGNMIASGSTDNTMKLWSLDGRELQVFTGHSDYVSKIAFSPNGKMIASGSADNFVKLWDLDGRELQNFKGHNDHVWGVAFSPDGKTIASGSWDKTIKLWNLNGKEIQTFKGHKNRISSVVFSPDGMIVASTGEDKTTILWNLDFDDLMANGCMWLKDYLTNNIKVSNEDRKMCGISAGKM